MDLTLLSVTPLPIPQSSDSDEQVTYFLPIYYQARGSSAIRSGVQLLAFICGVICKYPFVRYGMRLIIFLVAVTLTGGIAPKVGYVQPFLIIGAVLACIGTGLLQLFDATTSQAMWVGITFLAGLGCKFFICLRAKPL